jgi:AcrR family transcriptional regulator
VTPVAQKASRRERSREAIAQRLRPSIEALLAAGASFTDLGLDEILEGAEVPRSTFYYHFRDKGDLLMAVSADAVAELITLADGLYKPEQYSSRRRFGAVVRRTVEAWLTHVPLMSALSELAAYNPTVREQFRGGWERAQEGLVTHIRAGQMQGFVRRDLHPEHVAAWLVWMAERGMSQLVWPSRAEELDAIAQALTAIVWHTLYPDNDAV